MFVSFFGLQAFTSRSSRRAFSPVVTVVGDHASYHLDYDAPLTSDIESLALPMSEWVYRVKGADYTAQELRTIQDWTISRKLRLLPGVADIVSFGGFIKQYEVNPDLAKLKYYKISLQQVFSALERGSSNAGGGYVEQGRQQILIRGIGLLRSAEEILDVVVAERNGAPVLVRHLATLTVGSVPRQGVVGQEDDHDIVTGVVLMRKGENPAEVLAAVNKRVAQLNKDGLPKGVEMVMPGDNVAVEVELITPVAMEKDLRFAIREGGKTVGAGVVTEILQ